MEIPYYTLEKPRDDAAGLWTARLELETPRPRTELLRQIGEFAIATQNVHALMTGYIEGDPGVEHGSAVILTRDPHPEEEYITLPPGEYEIYAQAFADAYDMQKVPYAMDDEFRVILGRVPGYRGGVARPMNEVVELFAMYSNSLDLQEGYFFSARYNDEDRWWDEHAVVVRGNVDELPHVGPVGHELGQVRFVAETHPHTFVFNMTGLENQEVI